MDACELIHAPIGQYLRGFWPKSAALGQLLVRGRQYVHMPTVEPIRVLNFDSHHLGAAISRHHDERVDAGLIFEVQASASRSEFQLERLDVT
ncbi:hypothetical protein C6A88_23340 [Mycolicibacterium austroafricanum]|nr:hypothetical protein C6A88_23340 [Mycolicibacterium austroafricanum]